MTTDFSQLTEKVNEAQAQIQETMRKGRDALRAQVEQAQDKVEQQADQMKAKAAQSKDDAAAGWQGMQDKWQAHIAPLHKRAADKKAERDVREAQTKADAAEMYAEDAINFAIAAVAEDMG